MKSEEEIREKINWYVDRKMTDNSGFAGDWNYHQNQSIDLLRWVLEE